MTASAGVGSGLTFLVSALLAFVRRLASVLLMVKRHGRPHKLRFCRRTVSLRSTLWEPSPVLRLVGFFWSNLVR